MRWIGFRPANGWRALLGEIGIIVAGVLIALGAQQAVDNWRWDRDVAAGRDALREDYRDIAINARERAELEPCLRARLGELSALLNANPGRTPGVQRFGSPPERPWAVASWDSLVSAGVSTHMPRDEMLRHALIARAASAAEQRVREEMEAWSHLYSLTGPSRPLDSGEAAAIRQSLAKAMYLLNLARLSAPQLAAMIGETGMLDRSDQARAEDALARVRQGPNWRVTCTAIVSGNGSRLEAPYDPEIQTDPLRHQRAAAQAQTKASAASRP